MFDYQHNVIFSAFHCITQAAFAVDTMPNLGVWLGTGFCWLLQQSMIHLMCFLVSRIALAESRLAFAALTSY
jgi:hypothetical protein